MEQIKVWITKYALTAGIKEVQVERSAVDGGMVVHRSNGWSSYYHKGQWHTDRKQAVAKAEAMRKRKIASLKKQLERLESLRFE